jgi:serine/threonine protein kinase
MIQSFARKLLHLMSLDVADVQNEIRAITKLCDGSHANIIKILRHGELPDSSHAFIDMELCDFNLEDFVKSMLCVARARASSQSSRQQRALEMWDIMHQIADGLTFIHEKGEVHRDLKPQNGLDRHT